MPFLTVTLSVTVKEQGKKTWKESVLSTENKKGDY